MEPRREANRRLWDEWAVIHARSDLYRLREFRAGEIKLNALERGELGPVTGKRLLHLMCHFGMDTLSWARLGAEVTGVDFSPEAVRLARELSEETGVSGRFLCCEIYDLPEALDETFDVVFTSYGVLSWLPDVEGWARIAARYVRPGGVFYMVEIHPSSLLFSDSVTGREWQVGYDYFETEALTLTENASYADRSAAVRQEVHYEWTYRLGEVVSALIAAGFRLEFLREHPFTVYQAFPFLERRDDGYWHAPAGMPRVPLLFSLRAVREQAR